MTKKTPGEDTDDHYEDGIPKWNAEKQREIENSYGARFVRLVFWSFVFYEVVKIIASIVR